MQKSIFFVSVVSALTLLGSCSDATFNGGSARSINDPNKTCTKPPCKNDPEDRDPNDPNSVRVRYGKDIKPSVADFLFVLDNSISMGDDAARVSQGLAAIAKETFPESTRIAVMTTMAASDPFAASPIVHADISTKDYGACINREPGFLSFVDRASVEAFKGCAGVPFQYAAKYAKSACESGWFQPFDTNANGDRCFVAALQNSFHAVGCEPGLLALQQLLQRNNGKPLFRENAAVSIIFISDEQVGCTAGPARGNVLNNAGNFVKDVGKTATNLKNAILQNSKVLSVKFHGIIPPDPGENVPTDTLSYQAVINHLGGKAFNISNPFADYNSMIDQLIQDKVDNTSSEFSIPATAKKVTSVEVDGVVTKAFTFDAGRSKVTLQGLDPNKTVDIVIRFE